MSTTPKHTPGPWTWRVQDNRVMLGTVGRGFTFVMGFERVGMQGAQPVFQVHEPDCDQTCHGCGVMTPATEIAQPRDHNGVGVLDHPDAHLIAAAPSLLAACEESRAWIDGLVGDDLEVCERSMRRVLTILRDAIAKAKGEG